ATVMAPMAVVKEPGLTHRQRQAMQTRTLIVDAARSLFVSRGYAATSLEAVAEMAGVASRTVYSVFGTKKALLGAICEAWLAEAGIPESIAEGLREPDLRRRLLIVARGSRLPGTDPGRPPVDRAGGKPPPVGAGAWDLRAPPGCGRLGRRGSTNAGRLE